MRDPNKRALLIEAVIAGGLIVIGIPTGQPLLALAASVGGNWAHSLAERGFQHWRDRWFTDDGVLNQDIAKALCHAFADAARQVEHDWKQHRHYQYLRHKSSEQAQLTLDTLRILREDGATLFQQSDQLVQVAKQQQHDRILSLLDQDESKANEYLKSMLAAFLYGHDDEFVMFITEQLGPQWILRFLEILKDPDEEGTRAWRACQLLWQKSLMLGIEQIRQTTAETADTVRWLKALAQQLKSQPPTQRDSTGQDALETILHSVHAQLDEMQKTLNKTYDTTLGIKARLEQVYQKVAPAEIAPSQVWSVPYQRNPYFTGRERILKHLHDTLSTEKAAALTQPLAPPQALSGLGGIGKTHIAVEYAYRHRDEYHDVLWVTAATRETLIADFVDLAHWLNLREKDDQDQNITVQAVKRWLEQHDQWLLIFDNTDDLALAEDFLPTGGKGHIVLTTRAQAPGTLANGIDVEEMDRDEGMLLLLRRAKVLARDAPLAQASETDRGAAETIVKEMDGLPLALDQAGAYIEETHCGVSDYLMSYRQRQAELLKRRGGTGKEHPEPVATTWSLSFEQVKQLNPMATDLLRVCAFLAPDAIPEEMLLEGASQLGTRLQPLTTDATRLNDAIGVLLRYSLVERNTQERTFSIHPLVQAVLKQSMNEQIRHAWAERTVRAINLAFPDVDEVKLWEQCERYLPHALVCATFIKDYNFEFTEASSLLTQTAYYLFKRAQYTQAEPLLIHALAIKEKHLGSEHLDTAINIINLAHLYNAQGKHEQAESLYQRALAIREKHLGFEHPDTATIITSLGRLYKAQGKYDQAQTFLISALLINLQHLGLEHPDTGTTLNNLTGLFQVQWVQEVQGLKEVAPILIDAMEHVLKFEEKQLGSEHPNTGATLHNLAWLYYIQGKYEQAEPFFIRALEIIEKHLGFEHPDTATILHNLATIYQALGKYEQAEPLLIRALEIAEKHLGFEHYHTAVILHDLATIYQALGKYEQGEPLYQRALAIRKQHFGSEHPQMITIKNKLSDLIEKMGQSYEAEEQEKIIAWIAFFCAACLLKYQKRMTFCHLQARFKLRTAKLRKKMHRSQAQ